MDNTELKTKLLVICNMMKSQVDSADKMENTFVVYWLMMIASEGLEKAVESLHKKVEKEREQRIIDELLVEIHSQQTQ